MTASLTEVILISVTNIASVVFLGCFVISMLWVINFRNNFYKEYATFKR